MLSVHKVYEINTLVKFCVGGYIKSCWGSLILAHIDPYMTWNLNQIIRFIKIVIKIIT
jgi:hypothetical protein